MVLEEREKEKWSIERREEEVLRLMNLSGIAAKYNLSQFHQRNPFKNGRLGLGFFFSGCQSQ